MFWTLVSSLAGIAALLTLVSYLVLEYAAVIVMAWSWPNQAHRRTPRIPALGHAGIVLTVAWLATAALR